MVAEVARIQLRHLVVVRLGGTEAPSERRRRLCLMRMFYELTSGGVTHLVAESRGPADDRRDRQLLDTIRAQRQAGGLLRLDHVRGPAEPMLWVPDIVAGAITSDRTAGTALAGAFSSLELIEIAD